MNKKLLFTRIQSLLETTQETLTATADKGRLDRSKYVVRNYAGIERDSSGNAVIHYVADSQKDPNKKYQCYVAVIPEGGITLFTLAHGKMSLKSKINLIQKADVKCFCSCPDFNWSGARYNSGHRYDSLARGYQSEPGVPDGSEIAGKNRTIGVCKHLLATFKGIKWSATKIMSDIKKAKFPNTQKENDIVNDLLDKEKEASLPKSKGNTSKAILEKPVTKDNSSEKALNILEHSEPKKLPEAQEALDGLASALTTPDVMTNTSTNTDNTEEVLTTESDTQNNDKANEALDLLSKPEPAKPNNMADIEEEAELPIFDVPLDQEDNLEQ